MFLTFVVIYCWKCLFN